MDVRYALFWALAAKTRPRQYDDVWESPPRQAVLTRISRSQQAGGTESLQTPRWRGVDSNFQFRDR